MSGRTPEGTERLEERVRLDRALLAMLARRGERNLVAVRREDAAARREARRYTPRRLRDALFPEDE